jgi:hypothetical protein
MGMEIGARVLEGNCYRLAPSAPFKYVGFMDGTDMRCTDIVRQALNFAGVNFGEIDGFLTLPQENIPKMITLVKVFQQTHNIPDYYIDVVSSLIQFMEICVSNNYSITIG